MEYNVLQSGTNDHFKNRDLIKILLIIIDILLKFNKLKMIIL